MIGDGLNDSGALGSADVGLAVSEDTSAFTPACDGILHAGNLSRLSGYLKAAHTARRIVYVSFGISLLYNLIGLGFAASGHLSPLVSAVLMPVSSVSVVGFGTCAAWFAARREGLA
jgi:Cu+-exporting ATPase